MKFYTIAVKSDWVSYNHIVCGTETIQAASTEPIHDELHNNYEESHTYTYDTMKSYFGLTTGDTSSDECFNYLKLELFTDSTATTALSGDNLEIYYFDSSGTKTATSDRDQLSFVVYMGNVFEDIEQILYLKATTRGDQSAIVEIDVSITDCSFIDTTMWEGEYYLIDTPNNNNYYYIWGFEIREYLIEKNHCEFSDIGIAYSDLDPYDNTDDITNFVWIDGD